MAADGTKSLSIDHNNQNVLLITHPIRILIESLEIMSRNKRIFLWITLFLSCPLSFLLFSLNFSSFRLKSQILRLEFLATVAPTRYESRQVWKESREVFLSLLRIKLIHLVPANLLATLTAIVSVDSAAAVGGGATIGSAIAAVKPAWTRVLATSICMYAISWMYAGIPITMMAMAAAGGDGGIRFGIWVVGLGVEVYLMAVLGMGLVVSVLEKKSGWEAIRVGFELMDGLRVCGWILSGLFAVATGLVGWRMELTAVDSGGDDVNGLAGEAAKLVTCTAVEGWERLALVGVYAVVVVWGFVVSTVYYKEVRKRHGIKDQVDNILDA
ncbi:hypothetical protein LINGRAPRIM_LOCUS726 [Linum grandiflorum]